MTVNVGAPVEGIVVVGGGVSGLTAAVEAAEAGCEVFLLEREPTLGGRVARMNEYFPKLCPPGCGLEINFRRIKQNPRIKVFTLAEVRAIEGQPGDFAISVDLHPRRVNDRCTACDQCVKACPVERPDSSSYGLGTTRAIYLPGALAHPLRYAIDPEACLGESCARCVAYCPYDAIDLAEPARRMVLRARAVVLATGWRPYDATRMENLGFGRLPDVITNVQMERLAARDGPTGGRIVRPSDGQPVRRVAFVQCAGSRDDNHLPFCSTVCCMATLKQATYLRRQSPEAEIHIFYIDIRTMGLLEEFFVNVQTDERLFLHKGKVARVERIERGLMTVVAEQIQSGQRLERVVDLVVLATGMEPERKMTLPVRRDAAGFALPPDPDAGGVQPAGCARQPMEVAAAVRDATAAALRAIGDLRR